MSAPPVAREVRVPGGLSFGVTELGAGPPLIYFHGVFDRPDNPLTAALAADHLVIAPDLPGFGASRGEAALAEARDGALALLDLADALDLGPVPVVGHCLGGMLAAELSVLQPARFSPLVLLAPFGAWDDAQPGLDVFAATPRELREALFGAGGSPAGLAEVATWPGAPELSGLDGEAALEARLSRARALAGAARLLWPIPDHGFSRRAHRLPGRTLVVSVADDRICPQGPIRALFSQVAELATVPGGAHLAHMIDPEPTAALVRSYVRAS